MVVTRTPTRVAPGEARRLAARARNRDAVLLPYLRVAGERESWPGADVRIATRDRRWHGIGIGSGRLRHQLLTVTTEGRGRAARPRSAALWLPAPGGGVAVPESAVPEPAVGSPARPLRKTG